MPSSCDPLMPAIPVMFPPGRAMLSTSPLSIASPLTRIATSGTVAVACLAATATTEAPTTISSTFRSTSSVARARYRWVSPPRPSGTPRRGSGPRPSPAPAVHPRTRPNARQARRRGPRSGAPARRLGPGEGAARSRPADRGRPRTGHPSGSGDGCRRTEWHHDGASVRPRGATTQSELARAICPVFR